jgi:hypothetical protein
MIAGGRTAQVKAQFLRPARGSATPRARQARRAGLQLRVASYPPYPAGGINGGHILATISQGDMTYRDSDRCTVGEVR